MNSEPRQKKLLIVEDDTDILEILETIFGDEGYTVCVSETGEETNHLHTINPNLILLDIRLSGNGKEGAEICTRLKSEDSTRKIPIILLSAESDVHRICIDCGADGYIKKPFDISHLTSMVGQFVGRQ
jgi:two-component system response regulator VicR